MFELVDRDTRRLPFLIKRACEMSESGWIEGSVRLQKLVFLCLEEGGVPFRYSFDTSYFGPYSEELAKHVRMLEEGV